MMKVKNNSKQRNDSKIWYDPNELKSIYHTYLSSSQSNNNININWAFQTTSQRALIQDIFMMLLNKQSKHFKVHQYYKLTQYGFEKTFNFELKHLTPDALTNTVSYFIQITSKSQYINNKLKIFQQIQGKILKSLLCAIRQYKNTKFDLIQQLLSIFYYQASKSRLILLVSIQSIEQSIKQQYKYLLQTPITLMKLVDIFKSYDQSTQFIIQLITKLIAIKQQQQKQKMLKQWQGDIYPKQILDFLYDKLKQNENLFMQQNHKTKTLILLFTPVFQTYIRFLILWIQNQQINDSQQQFFIKKRLESNERFTIRKVKLYQKGQIIQKELTPKLFKKWQQQILYIGKSMKILKQFLRQDQKIKLKKQVNTFYQMNIDKLQHLFYQRFNSKFNIQQLQTNTKLQLHQTHNQYSICHKLTQISVIKNITLPDLIDDPLGAFALNSFNPFVLQYKQNIKTEHVSKQKIIIQRRSRNYIGDILIGYQYAIVEILKMLSNKLRQLFQTNDYTYVLLINYDLSIINYNNIVKYKLNLHLQGIKKFLLIQHGQFSLILIQNISQELNKSFKNINQIKLLKIIKQSLESCGAKYFKQQVLRRIQPKMINNYDKYQNSWNCFTLTYKLQQPQLYIIPEPFIQIYSKLFNFLFKLKKIQYDCNFIWRNNKLYFKSTNPVFHFCNILRTNIYWFINTLLNYFMTSIQGNWVQFIDKINKADSFTDVIKIHEKCIKIFIDITYLSPQKTNILKNINKIIDLIGLFKDFNLKLYNQIMINQIRQFEHKQIKDIRELYRKFEQQKIQLLKVLHLDESSQFLITRLTLNKQK